MRAQIPVQQRAPENVREAAPEEQEDRSQYVENRSEAPARGPQPPRRIEPVRAEPRVGRNDPCPCGSGKKFKNCHGRGL
jgi:preprotein translocase subunit SecA